MTQFIFQTKHNHGDNLFYICDGQVMQGEVKKIAAVIEVNEFGTPQFAEYYYMAQEQGNSPAIREDHVFTDEAAAQAFIDIQKMVA